MRTCTEGPAVVKRGESYDFSTLRLAHAQRMVVGHTVQETINDACDGRLWRIDIGLSRHYAGPIEALEINGNKTRVLRGDRTTSVLPAR